MTFATKDGVSCAFTFSSERRIVAQPYSAVPVTFLCIGPGTVSKMLGEAAGNRKLLEAISNVLECASQTAAQARNEPYVGFVPLDPCRAEPTHGPTIDSPDASPAPPRERPTCVPQIVPKVYFLPHSDDVPPQVTAMLDTVVTVLKEYRHTQIQLIGHIDADEVAGADAPYARKLGERRAQRVAEYLTSHGIEANRVTWISSPAPGDANRKKGSPTDLTWRRVDFRASCSDDGGAR